MLAKVFGNLDYRHWILSHLVWVVGVSVALIIGRAALQDHDQRVLADAQIKTDQASIASLQKQIASTNSAAAQKVQTIVKIVHDVQTPAQAVPAIPKLTDVPLNARVLPDNPVQVGVDALPLIQILGQAKQDAVNLAACQSDLKNQQAIGAQKDDEIATLKKKPSLVHRIFEVAKVLGIGIGIGAVLGAHAL
jgi:hypothetical protein